MHRLAFVAVMASASIATPSFVLSQNIVAHRGASHDAPENTLAAFKLAWEQGADGIEADFYLSADGRIVCIHDKDTERTAGVKHVIAETSYDVLRKLDVGSWKDPQYEGERIPLCSEVLATVPRGKLMIVELKAGPEIVAPVKKDVEASSLEPEQILFICFQEETAAECKKQMPHIRCHWLTSYEENGDGQLKPGVDEVLAALRRTKVDGLGSQAKPEHVDARFLSRLKQGGCREFHVWTVNEPDIARFYQEFSPWGITTDRPGWLREQLQIPAKASAVQ